MKPSLGIRNLQRGERIDRRLLEEAVRATLRAAGLSGRGVSIALVGDRAMARLNRRWTGRVGPTDVLAFPLEEGDYLGEVVVSTRTCRRQADERGRAFEEELALLVAHGILHLAGYDHTKGPGEEKLMRRKERQSLRKLKKGTDLFSAKKDGSLKRTGGK